MAIGTAAAIIGAGALGALASSSASSKAASAQRDAANQASATEQEMLTRNLEMQQKMFDKNIELQEPWRQQGIAALSQLGAGTAAGGDFNRDFTAADFVKDPGYDFRMQQGTQAVERSAAARGGALSGGALKQLTRYGQGLASDEYANAYNRFNTDRDKRFGRLATLAGIGQTATGQLTQQGANSANSMSQLGANAANNIGNYQTQAGNARASGYVGQANALNSGLSTIGNAFLNRPASTGYTPSSWGSAGLDSFYFGNGTSGD